MPPPTLDCWPHSGRGLAYTVLLHIQSPARSWPIAGAHRDHGGGTGEEALPRPPARRAHLTAPHGEPVCAPPAAQGATQSSRSPFLQDIRDILLENCQRWATCFLPNTGLDRAESLEELSCSPERPPHHGGRMETVLVGRGQVLDPPNTPPPLTATAKLLIQGHDLPL